MLGIGVYSYKYGKENGNYYLGFRVWGLGFIVALKQIEYGFGYIPIRSPYAP